MWEESHQTVINNISDIPGSTGGDTTSAPLCNHPLWTAALPLWNLRRTAGDIDSCWRPGMKIRSEQRDKTNVHFYSSTSTQPKRNDAIVPEAPCPEHLWSKVLSICRDIDIGRTTFVNMLPHSDAPTHMAVGSYNIFSARFQAFGLIVPRLMLQLSASVACRLLQSFLFVLQLRNTCCTYHHLLQFEALQILAVVAFVVLAPRLRGDLLQNKLNRTATQATVLCLMDDVMANS